MTTFAGPVTFGGTTGDELSAFDSNFSKAFGASGDALITAAGRLRASTTTAARYAHATAPASADYSVQADVHIASSAGTPSAFVMGRVASGEVTYYSAGLQEQSGSVNGFTLGKLVAGVATVLGRDTTITYTAPNTCVLDMSGSTIRGLWNGSELFNVSDSSITAAGAAGLGFSNSSAPTDSATYHLDNWQADEAGGASHAATGALAAQAATIAGTAADVAAYTSSGALSAQAATVAGTATHLTLHASSGALEAQAATVAGTAAHTSTGSFEATGALSAQTATVAGTAAHMTLHAATGDLVADAASVSGAAVDETTFVPSRNTGAGKSRKSRQRYVLTIDGRDLIVSSPEEAQALIDDVKSKAEAAAQTALDRANASKRRPVGKVLRDARKALVVPSIEAPPEIADYAAKVIRDIRERYEAQLRDIEITALLHKQQQQEEDDEDILLLIA